MIASQIAETQSRLACIRMPAALLIWVAMGTATQPDARAMGADAPDALHRDPNSTDVYLNDSFEASDAIMSARQLARNGEWDKAVELLHRTSETSGNKLTRVDAGYYAGIRRHIAHLIASWPREGVMAYRARFEHAFRTLYEKRVHNRRIDELLDLHDRFFCTAGAGELTHTIGQLAIEVGDFALAQRLYQRALAHHPDRESHRETWQVMATLIDAIANGVDVDRSDVNGNVTLSWMGGTRSMDDILDGIARTFKRAPALAPDQWPIFGGDPSRTRIGTSRVDELGLLWRITLSDALDPDANDGMGNEPPRGESDGPRLSVHPAVIDSMIVIQRYRDVMALQQNTGAEIWRFRADAGGRLEIDDFDERPPGWEAVTISGSRVYAALPGDVVPFYGYESARSATELVCLDLATGRPVWRSSQATLGDSFSELHLDSAPIVVRGKVYVVGRRRRSFGFEDCYLFCFNASDGGLRFRTHLGSASTGTFGSRQATLAIPAMEGDTIYVGTNLGTVAAVSAHTGDVRWLRLYERALGRNRGESSYPIGRTNPWEFNAVIVSEARVLVLANDSHQLQVLSAADGHPLHTVPVEDMEGMRTLLGIRDELICGSGSQVCCYDLASRTLVWSSPFDRDDEVAGRGVWADDRLLIPTQRGVRIFQVEDGRRRDLDWDADGRAGNLLALGDRLIVSGTNRISTYVRKEEVWSALRQRMESLPSDPGAALDLAEIAFGSGEIDEAMAALEEAVRRAGNFSVAIDATTATRVFNNAIGFAQRLAGKGRLDPGTLDTLFGYAAQSPTDRTRNIRYRTVFAKLYEQHDQPDRALQLYQQILMDRSLRDFRYESTSEPGEDAGRMAEHAIDALIHTHGPTPYESFERQAAGQLVEARQASDEAGIRRIVASYPNSRTAAVAMIALGDLAAARGDADVAAREFAAAYHRHPKQVDRPELLRKIADAYENAGELENAYRWLTKAALEHPNLKISVNGATTTFRRYRKRLDRVKALVEPSRPEIAPPLDVEFMLTLTSSAKLLSPFYSNEPACGWSRFFVHSPDGVRAHAAADGRELWNEAAPVSAAPTLLLATESRVVLATPFEVCALDAQDGRRLWSFADYPEGFGGEQEDWEDGGVIRAQALAGNRLVVARGNGAVECIDIESGRSVWSKKDYPTAEGLMAATETSIAYHEAREQGVVIHKIDAVDGQLVQSILLDESRPLLHIFITLDDAVIAVTSQTIHAYDTDPVRLRWRTKLDGRIYPATLLLGLDALYFSDDGRSMTKISLQDGKPIWQSQQVIPRGATGPAAQMLGSNVIVSAATALAAIDAPTSMTLWRGMAPEGARFEFRLLTTSYVVALHIPDPAVDSESTCYFYDHRNGSGVIPRDGGTRKLGRLSSVKEVLVCNSTLVIQDGTTIRAWKQP